MKLPITKKKKNTYMGIVLAILTIAVVTMVNDAVNKTRIDKATYDQIEIGMTYEQVCNMIGTKGKPLAQEGTPGQPDYMVIYGWAGKGPYGAVANIKFENNLVVEKAENKLT